MSGTLFLTQARLIIHIFNGRAVPPFTLRAGGKMSSNPRMNTEYMHFAYVRADAINAI
jgi:hypothetical protein